MSDTPRTDAVYEISKPGEHFPMLNLSRQLERELQQAQAQVEALQRELSESSVQIARLRLREENSREYLRGHDAEIAAKKDAHQWKDKRVAAAQEGPRPQQSDNPDPAPAAAHDEGTESGLRDIADGYKHG